jgi:hypothetical protein
VAATTDPTNSPAARTHVVVDLEFVAMLRSEDVTVDDDVEVVCRVGVFADADYRPPVTADRGNSSEDVILRESRW